MINSIKKASGILKFLSSHYPESVSLALISETTGISKSTCAQMLSTLISESLVEKKGYSKYCLGAGCFMLTRSGKFDEKHLNICRPVLRWLRDKTGETTIISQIRSGVKYNVDYMIGNYVLNNSGYDIAVDPIYSTPSGRIIMAHSSFDELCDIVEKHSLPTKEQWRDFNSIDELQKELRFIKQQPFSILERANLTGFAAPIFIGKRIFGTIGIAVKTDGIKPYDYYTVPLLRAAKEITKRLNFEEI